MIDLHSHLLPGVDDGAPTLEAAIEMARMWVSDGVQVVACTPHILPGMYHNSGPQITEAVTRLGGVLRDRGIALELVTGADNHIVPDFVAGLNRGHLLPIAGSRYVLVEPPHHVAPARLDHLFFEILASGRVPVLTHPERLSWIEGKYPEVCRLVDRGVWLQVTSGSLRGTFGRRPRYWAEKLLAEGKVHILASDAHDPSRRPPDLSSGRRRAESLVGSEEALHLVVTRPHGIITDMSPQALPAPASAGDQNELVATDVRPINVGGVGALARRLRSLLR